MYRFWVCWSSFDLYFAGIKKDVNMSDNSILEFSRVCDSVDVLVNGNNSKIKSRVKKTLVELLGEPGLNKMRKLKLKNLSYQFSLMMSII